MDIEQAAQKIAWDIDGTLKRFSNNRMLLERFVKKFPADTTYARLEQAVAQKNYPEIETLAHTLKGVAGNLGFQDLFEWGTALVNAVRAGELERVEPLWAQVREAYGQVVGIISQIEWE